MLSNKSQTPPDEGLDPNYKYRVNFVNDDENFLWGSDDITMTPSRYEGPMPAKTATDQLVYDFEPTNATYWTKSKTLDGKIVYKTRFTELSNNLNFEMNKDGESVSVEGFKNSNVDNETVVVNAYYKGEKSNDRVLPIASVGGFGVNKGDDVRLKNPKKLVLSDNVEVIEDEAFKNCSRLSSITWSRRLKKIDDYAFLQSGVTRIEFPQGLISLGEGSFSGSNLVEAVLPDSIINIGKGVFRGCKTLINVNIPNAVHTIPAEMFADCISLTKITIPNNVRNIGNFNDGNGFSFARCLSLKEVNIAPYGVGGLTIQEFSFYYCENLTTINLTSVTKIANSAFSHCNNLEGLYLRNIEIIGASAFSNCFNAYNLFLGDRLKKIETGAFQEMKSIKSVYIPSVDVKVEFRIFNGCISLKSIRCEASESRGNDIAYWDKSWNGCSATVEWGALR